MEFRLKIGILFFPNEFERGFQIFLSAFKVGDAGNVAFNAGFAASDFGGVLGIGPKVGLSAFLFEFL